MNKPGLKSAVRGFVHRRLRWTTTAALLALVLTGCTDGSSVAHDPGLLRNPEFAAGDNGGLPAWGFVQHASRGSYRWSVDGGVLTIERVGREPWGQASQTIPAAELAGRRLEFSAELSGQLDPRDAPVVAASGVAVRVRGRKAGMPAMLDPMIMLSASGTPELGPGYFDWQRQAVVFEVPREAIELQVSIRLGMYGKLHAREPRLLILDDGPEDPAPTSQ